MGYNKTSNDIHPLIRYVINTHKKMNLKNILGQIYRIIESEGKGRDSKPRLNGKINYTQI